MKELPPHLLGQLYSKALLRKCGCKDHKAGDHNAARCRKMLLPSALIKLGHQEHLLLHYCSVSEHAGSAAYNFLLNCGTNPSRPERKLEVSAVLRGTHSIFHSIRSGIRDIKSFALTAEKKKQSEHNSDACVSFSSPAHVTCEGLNQSARQWVPAAFFISSQQMVLSEGLSSFLAASGPKELNRPCRALVSSLSPGKPRREKKENDGARITLIFAEGLAEGQKATHRNMGLLMNTVSFLVMCHSPFSALHDAVSQHRVSNHFQCTGSRDSEVCAHMYAVFCREALMEESAQRQGGCCSAAGGLKESSGRE